MSILHKDPPAPLNRYEEAERQAKNLRARAKRKGLSSAAQAQREWIKANPVGFEVR